MRTLILMVVLAITAVPAVANEIDVGGTKLVIPAPPGFAPVTPRMANLQDMLRTFVPDTNVEFLSFIPQELVEASLDGEIPLVERRFAAQTTKDLVSQSINTREYRRFRDDLRQSISADKGEVFAKAAERVSARIEEETGVDIQAKIDGVREVGTYTVADRMIASSILVNHTHVDQNGQTVADKSVGSYSIIHVRGKVLFLYAFAEEAAADWSRNAVLAWSDAVLKANPPDLRSRITEATPQWLLGMDWGSVGQSALIGGVIGAVLSLLGWFRRKKGAE